MPSAADSVDADSRKRRKVDGFDINCVPLPAPLNGSTAQWSLQHQITSLQFGYSQTPQGPGQQRPRWICHGTTTLYVMDNNANDNANAASVAASGTSSVELALHLRSSVTVDSVRVEHPVAGRDSLAPDRAF